MKKPQQEKEDPLSSPFSNNTAPSHTTNSQPEREENSVVSFFKNLIKPKIDASTLRETIEEYIEEDNGQEKEEPSSRHEKALLANVLKIRDMQAADIMVPRAEIIAINNNASQEELFGLLAHKQYSRLPVYADTLDNVIGTIHIKDILACLAAGQRIEIPALVREALIISPAMQVLDLLLQMRQTRKHLALVIDEFGGIDGLITIGDVIEAIIGDIDDEHDPDNAAQITTKPDGSIIIDARYPLDEFEDVYGNLLSEEEREENDTIGGLSIFLSGRVPTRGERLHHRSGMVLEIVDADLRRVKKICIRNLPTTR